jgi:hypothetical protein
MLPLWPAAAGVGLNEARVTVEAMVRQERSAPAAYNVELVSGFEPLAVRLQGEIS